MKILSPQETLNELGTQDQFEEAHPFQDLEHNELLDEKLLQDHYEECLN